MEFGIIFIIVIVIGLISAASQGKKKGSQNEESSGQPARRPAMSDIQRAFMMMTGLEDEEQQQPARTAPVIAPPPPRSEPPRPFNEGNSGYGSVASGSMRGDFTRPASGSMQYNALPTSGQGFGVTPASFEGTNFETLTARSEINDDGSNSLLAHRLDESVEIADTADLNREKRSEQGNLKPALKLFQGQGEFVKAIIYSEILAPRSQSRRSAK